MLFLKLFPVQFCEFTGIVNEHGGYFLTDGAFSHRLPCAISSTVCLCERWSCEINLLSSVCHSEVDRQGHPAALLISKRGSSVFLSGDFTLALWSTLRWCKNWWAINVVWLPMQRCVISTQSQHSHQNAIICIYSTIDHPMLELYPSINQQINTCDTTYFPR